MRAFFSIALFAFFIAVDGATGIADGAEIFKDCAHCPVMVKLPSGTFLMGTPPDKPEAKIETKIEKSSDPGPDQAKSEDEENAQAPEKDDRADERPQHKVTFAKPFAIGRYAVTRGEFSAFVRETGYIPGVRPGDEAERVWLPEGPTWRNPGFAQTDRHPVVLVSFNDAKRYAAWLARKTGKPYRLPTEAEWEYAARAGTTTLRYWESEDAQVCRHANVFDRGAAEMLGSDNDNKDEFIPCRDGHTFTSPSGFYPPNAFGLYDMLGNVWQWVQDCYTGDYKDAPADGSVAKSEDGSCTRVLRGGSWATDMDKVRSAFRHGGDSPKIFYGFRVVRGL